MMDELVSIKQAVVLNLWSIHLKHIIHTLDEKSHWLSKTLSNGAALVHCHQNKFLEMTTDKNDFVSTCSMFQPSLEKKKKKTVKTNRLARLWRPETQAAVYF